MTRERGQLIVYSGPSGVGKGTLLKTLLAPDGPLTLSVSATTRSPRPGEIDGIHYHFVSREQFEGMIADGEMLEYTTYNGHYFGTPKAFVDQQHDAGHNVILEIETKGASQVRKICPYALMIFVMPPSFDTLSKRLAGRGTEAEKDRVERLKAATEEVALAREYDFIIINDDVDLARKRLLCAISAGRLISRLNKDWIEEVLKDAKTSDE